MARKRKKRLRIRPVLVMFLLLIGIVSAITLIVRSFSGVIGNEAILFLREGVSAVVVRDEEPLMTTALGAIDYLVDEGALVPMGTNVAHVYRSVNNENLLQQLYNVQQQIYDYQINTKWQDVVNPDLTNIQERIAVKYEEIAKMRKLQQSDVDLLVLQRELTELLNERTEFLRGSTQPDSQLNEWYQSERNIADALESSRETIEAFATGRISFHMDGYESVLNAQTLHLISTTDISDTLSGQEVRNTLGDRDHRALYRIAQTDKWYVAIATNRRDNYVMAEGNHYQLQIVGQDQTYSAQVVRVVRDTLNSLYILEVNGDVQPVMNIRTCKINITGQFNELTVNKRAVIFDEDGNASIDIGNKQYVAIEVISESEDKYVFRSSAPLQPGQRVDSPEG